MSLTLIDKLLLFCLAWLFSFHIFSLSLLNVFFDLSFYTGKKQAEDLSGGLFGEGSCFFTPTYPSSLINSFKRLNTSSVSSTWSDSVFPTRPCISYDRDYGNVVPESNTASGTQKALWNLYLLIYLITAWLFTKHWTQIDESDAHNLFSKNPQTSQGADKNIGSYKRVPLKRGLANFF